MTIEDVITVFIVGTILLVTVFLLKSKKQFKYSHGPELVTTIGIFGTFLGVSIAIWTLASSKDVISSLPSFIASLKLAFIGSAFGVLAALVIRFFQWYGKKEVEFSNETLIVSEKDSNELIVQELKTLNKSLAGPEQGTLLSEIKLMRLDFNDQISNLRKSFDEFSQNMLENNQKAFIEALNNAIQDFNKNLTEQFGENFKQLNIAVGKLVEWQENYKNQLEELIVTEKSTSESMRIASDAYSEIVKSSSEFERILRELGVVIPSIKSTTDGMLTLSQSLAEVLRSMKDVTPEFATKVDSMLKQLDIGISNLLSVTTKTIEVQISQSVKQMNDSYQMIAGAHSDSVRNYSSQIQNSTSELKELLTGTIKDNQKLLNSNLEDSLSKIKESVTALDKGLEQELTRSLESLSHQLASLSAKFVDDYTPLTERLRDILKIAESIRR